MVKYNYWLFDGRIQYKYTRNKYIKWLYIPYENEIEPLLKYIHFNNNHLKKDRMAVHIINSGFFWFGYTEYITNFIDKCGFCHCNDKLEKVPKQTKIIT